MAQLMPLPLTVSCFSKIQTGFTFLVLAHPGSPGQRAVKRVCVCVYDICTVLRKSRIRGAGSQEVDSKMPKLVSFLSKIDIISENLFSVTAYV